jgi:hypothetical protein
MRTFWLTILLLKLQRKNLVQNFNLKNCAKYGLDSELIFSEVGTEKWFRFHNTGSLNDDTKNGTIQTSIMRKYGTYFVNRRMF